MSGISRALLLGWWTVRSFRFWRAGYFILVVFPVGVGMSLWMLVLGQC